MDSKASISWQATLSQTYEEFATQLIAFAPQLAAAVALLTAGWLLAHLLRVAVRKLVNGFGFLYQGVAKSDPARGDKMRRSNADIVAKIVFWLVILFFIAAAANMLGWQMVSNWIDGIIFYLPNLITGLFIILAGIILGNVAKAAVSGAAASAAIAQAEVLGRVSQMIVLFTALVIGIEQIGIEVDFLTNILIVVIGVLFAGGALAFGLGARSLVANIIGAQHLRKHCRIGEHMQIGDVEGSLIEVTQTSIVLETDAGRAVVPAMHFQEMPSIFRTEKDESANDTANAVKKGA